MYVHVHVYNTHDIVLYMQLVFIDHNSRRTTFIDPRLPYPGNNLVHTETQQSAVVVRCLKGGGEGEGEGGGGEEERVRGGEEEEKGGRS